MTTRSKGDCMAKSTNLWAAVYTRATGIWELDLSAATIQVAAVLLNDRGEILDEYISFVDPEDQVDNDDIKEAGFSIRAVRAAPTRQEVGGELKVFLKRAKYIVAHDVRFHRESLRSIGVTHRVWRCTRAMMFYYTGAQYRPKLTETADMLGIQYAQKSLQNLMEKTTLAASIYVELERLQIKPRVMLPPWPAPYAKPYVKPYRSYTKYSPPPPRSTGSTGFIGMLGRGIGRGLAGGGRRGGRGNYPGGSISFGFTSKRTRYPKK